MTKTTDEPLLIKKAPVQREVNCPFCTSDDKGLAADGSTIWEEKPREFRFSKCNACGLVFLDPRPDAPQWLEDYSKYQAGGRRGGRMKLALRRLMHQAFLNYPSRWPDFMLGAFRGMLRGRWAKYEEEHCHTILPWCGSGQGRLLDVGSAAGDKLIKMARLGWNAVGVEPSEQAAEEARRHHQLDVRGGTLEEQRFEKNSFDAATMISVVEHLPDPLSALREVHRVLAPGGDVLIDVPNFDSRLREAFGPCWTQYAYPWHLSLFIEKTLRNLIERAGFKIEYIRHHCSLSLYKKAYGRAKKVARLAPNLPTGDAAIRAWFKKECEAPRGELMLALCRKS